MQELQHLLEVLQGPNPKHTRLTLENFHEVTLRRLKTDRSPETDLDLLHPTPSKFICTYASLKAFYSCIL